MPSESGDTGRRRAAPRPAPAGGAAASAAAPALQLLLHQTCTVVAAFSQVIITCSQWKHASSWHAQAQTLALALGLCALAVCILACPEVYWRHRKWILPSARVMLYTVPTVRQTGVGASLMLERPAQLGWWGAVADFWRVLAGTRLLGVLVGGVAFIVNPAATLAVQAFLGLLTHNPEGYCSTQLMQAPLTRRRAATLASLLEFAALPVLMMVPLAEKTSVGGGLAQSLLRGHASPTCTCQSLLQFLWAALGILLPTALATRCWDDAPAPDDAHLLDLPEDSPPAASSGTGAARRQQQQAAAAAGAAAGGSVWARLVGAAASATSAANAALHFLFCSTPSFESQALLSWWLLALCWWMASRLVGRSAEAAAAAATDVAAA